MTTHHAAQSEATPVTVIGQGPMGQSLAHAFIDAGHPTTVWNRTPGRADVLVQRGAKRAPTSTQAVAASPVVVTCLRDDLAVDEVFSNELVAETLRGRTLVNLTSTTPQQSRKRAEWATRCGIDYLAGAILTPTPTIGRPEAVVLYCGPEPLFQAEGTTLAALGGSAIYLGADSGRAAGYDVALLDLFWMSVMGVVHAIALARAEGITGDDLAPYTQAISTMLPEMMTRFGQQAQTGNYPGERSTISSAAASLAHITEAAHSHGMGTNLLDASRGVVQRALDGGYSNDGLGRLVDVLANPSL